MTEPATPPSLRQKGPIGFRTKGADGPAAHHLHTAAGTWPWAMAIGLIAVITGAFALLDADTTLRTLAIIIGTSQTAQGALSIAATWRTPSGLKDRTLHLITGVLLTVGGVSSIASAAAGTRSLVIASGLWFAIVAFQDFADAIKTKPRRLWNAALGAVSLLAAVLTLTHPDLSLAVTAGYIGATLIARGLLLIGRSLVHRHQETAARPGTSTAGTT